MSTRPIVGIDLGTTNSEIAIIRDGRPEVLEEDGEPMVPSAVGLDAGGELLVGTAARNQAALAPERTVLSVKRSMGTDAIFELGGQTYRPPEISAMILRTLRERAERVLGEPVDRAVITVPAYFKESARQATVEAGELAGLTVERILNEPTAAAMTYRPQGEARERILVYDLGGGTFDVSIVQMEAGVVEVLASHGDTELGGDDLDDLLFEQVRAAFEAEHGVDLGAEPVVRSRLLRAVEAARRELSFHAVVPLAIEFVAEDDDGTPLHLERELDRLDFDELIEPVIDRTLKSVDRAMADADLRAADIDRIVLVGGVTRTPRIQAALEEKLGRPVHGEVEPDLCVALGAAMQGGLIEGLDVGPVLVDITPHTLGVECGGMLKGRYSLHVFVPVIPRGTALPASRTEMFMTNHDGQEAAHVPVLQGEQEDARENTPLGALLLDELSDAPAGNRIPVRFDLDLNGMLHVTVSEHTTGRAERAAFENALAGAGEGDREASRRRVDEAMGGPALAAADETVDDLPPALREALEEAGPLVERARLLRDEVGGEDAEDIGAALAAFEAARDQADADRVRKVIPELEDLVFYLEGE